MIDIKKLLLTILVHYGLFTSVIMAQNTVKGKVVGQDQHILTNATVSLTEQLNATEKIRYSSSDDEGSFYFENVQLPAKLDVRFLGYKPFQILLSSLPNKEIICVLEGSEINLDEVIANNNKNLALIKDDTTHYNLSSLALKEDDRLEQILKRIPGFKVSGNSKIVHQGTEINKILINGKEVFNYQNKIALEHIAYKMLEDISVINNYKDPFEINLGKENQEKVLNLQVKKSFLNIIKGNIELLTDGYRHYKIKPFVYNFSEKFSIFSLNNFNNIYDKEMSNDDFTAEQKFANSNSVYFPKTRNEVFWAKDITLNKEQILSNSITMRGNFQKLSLHATLNYNKVKSLGIQEVTSTLLGDPFFSNSTSDTLNSHLVNGSINLRYKLRNDRIIGNYTTFNIDKMSNNTAYQATYYIDPSSFSIQQKSNSNTTILNNKIFYESKISDNLSWKSNWFIKSEAGKDVYFLLPTNTDITINNQNIQINSIHNNIHTELNLLLHENNTILLAIEKEFQNIDLNGITQNMDILNRDSKKSFLNLQYIGKFKKFTIDAAVLPTYWNIRSGKTQQDDFNTNISIDLGYYIDHYRKNQIVFKYINSISPVAIQYGIPYKIIAYDNRLIGDSSFLTNFNRIESLSFTYHYEYPFKGRSFTVSARRNQANQSYIAVVNTQNIRLRNYMKVKGWVDWLENISYGQYLFMDDFPLVGNISIDFQQNNSYQIASEELIKINQNSQNIIFSLSSFSDQILNLTAGGQVQRSRLKFSQAKTSKQQQLSLYAGPKLETSTFKTTASLKYSKTNYDEQQNIFFDIDCYLQYKISAKLALFIDGFNLMQTLHIKSNQLASIENRSGISYYSRYLGGSDYLVTGLKVNL